MKIEADFEVITNGDYDKRNLTYSKNRKYKYPSKKMFIEFLKQYEDVDGVAKIWSEEDWTAEEVRIKVELCYKIKGDANRDNGD